MFDSAISSELLLDGCLPELSQNIEQKLSSVTTTASASRSRVVHGAKRGFLAFFKHWHTHEKIFAKFFLFFHFAKKVLETALPTEVHADINTARSTEHSPTRKNPRE